MNEGECNRLLEAMERLRDFEQSFTDWWPAINGAKIGCFVTAMDALDDLEKSTHIGDESKNLRKTYTRLFLEKVDPTFLEECEETAITNYFAVYCFVLKRPLVTELWTEQPDLASNCEYFEKYRQRMEL